MLNKFHDSSEPLTAEDKRAVLLHPADFSLIHPGRFYCQEDIDDCYGRAADTLFVFTDGSRSECRDVGASIVYLDCDAVVAVKKFSLHPLCSNYQAENLAIYKAILKINDKCPYSKAFDSINYLTGMRHSNLT